MNYTGYNDLEKYGQGHEVSLSKRMNYKDNNVSFKLPNAFNKIYMNLQSCIMATIIYINSWQFFRQAPPPLKKKAKIVVSIK